MFQKNQYVIYGYSGVCKVLDISMMDMEGKNEEKLYYTLQPLSAKDSLIYTPVDNKKVVMRDIISKEEAEQLIMQLNDFPLLRIESDKLREEQFKQAIKSCDCKEWIKMTKTIYHRKQERIAQGKKVTATDERYFKMAEDYLYSELSVALKIKKDEVGEYIKEKIQI